MGLLRLTIGYLKAIHIRVTLGHLKVTIGSFFSELHPKVRPTCSIYFIIFCGRIERFGDFDTHTSFYHEKKCMEFNLLCVKLKATLTTQNV